mgnify:CR=1 FL=1|tara:strand:- start:1076 stop:1795 length:720 start_codon:yes stop_codon:yes gene_type:complete
MSKLDILAFGAHPDDVELGCAGTILLQKSLGYKIGIIDLTQGELGTRGNKQLRIKESNLAAQKMHIDFRDNLCFKDGYFEVNKVNKLKIIERIREHQPSILLVNAQFDRHPDHGKASELVCEASFLSGLAKITTYYNNDIQKPWRPKVIYHYIQYNDIKPDFLVDISTFIDKKMEVINCYSSQFYNPTSIEPQTLISSKSFIDLIKSRSADLGRFISADYAEGFCVQRYMGVKNMFDLL